MIFKPELAEAVMRHEKTMTRRIAKDGDNLGLCRYVPGRRYAVQPGRGKKAIGHIIITHVHKEPLGAVTDADAAAEALEDRDTFLDYWRELHGDVDEDLQVWVIQFVVDRSDEPRLLARGGGYTASATRAVDDAGEAVPEDVQEVFCQEGGQANVARAAEYERTLRERPISDIVRDLEAIHGTHGIDLSRSLAQIRRAAERAQAKAVQHGVRPKAA